MHHEIDLPVEECDFELLREETLFDATREVRRRVDVTARRHHGDFGAPRGRGRHLAERGEHRARLPQREIAAATADAPHAHASRLAAEMNRCNTALTSEVS